MTVDQMKISNQTIQSETKKKTNFFGELRERAHSSDTYDGRMGKQVIIAII